MCVCVRPLLCLVCVVSHPCGLRSSESSMLCWKLGEPRSGVALVADVVDAVLIVVVHRLAVPLVQALGGLVRKVSDSARFFTWCITPVEEKKQDIQLCGQKVGSFTIMFHLFTARV